MKEIENMKTIINKNTLRIIKSRYFYLSTFIIVFSGFLTFMLNYNLYSLYNYKHIGMINAFIFSNIINNMITADFLPIIISLPILILVVENQMEEIKGKKDFFIKIINISTWGALVILVAYVSSYILCILLSPYHSNNIISSYHGLFAELYSMSMFLYTMIYILHSVICGIVFVQLSYSLYCLTNNFFFSLVIPNAYYCLSLSFKGLFSGRLLLISNYVLPTLSYDFTNTDNLLVNATQIVTMFLLSIAFWGMTYLRNMKKKLD